MKDLTETICALATPPGRSGIAVVRVSGPKSLSYFQKIFATRSKFETLPMRRAMLGQILNPANGGAIDEAIAICFSAPHSYTGEDEVELSLHGSPVLISELLESLGALGARIAEPGEFTMRAFLHGRLDLTQAEAVNDIISATTLFQAQVAARQHSGELAARLKRIKEKMIDIVVNLESAVEFVEEDLPLASREKMSQQLESVQGEIGEWIDSYRRGKIVKEGFCLAIIGRPNVGKSSLFNALLAQDRSIVTEIPGTTRDLVSEYMNIEGIPVRLQDTAGIQNADNHIEKLGIDRSIQAMADADAVLLVTDTSETSAEQDYEIRERLEGLSCIAVMNKCDLNSLWSQDEKRKFAGEWPCVDVSAKSGAGIAHLRKVIVDGLWGAHRVPQDTVLITNLRHVLSLQTALAQLDLARGALQEGLSEEFVLMHMHHGLERLGEITGETHVEDLLTEIFARFCVGK